MPIKTYTSKELEKKEDLYSLQDKFCCSGIPFKYQMTEGELGWLKHIRGKYSIADWVDKQLDGDILLFNCQNEIKQALDDDCQDAGKATMLSDDTQLQRLFFWMY